MPSTEPAETPPEKTLRRFYEGKLAERLMQAASMEQHRQMLRRGARKQQDGTLGQPGEPAPEDDVHIHIGDIHSVQSSEQGPQDGSAPEPKRTASVLAKAALLAAGLLGGGGLGAAVPWLAGAYQWLEVTTPPPIVIPSEQERTRLDLDVVPGGALDGAGHLLSSFSAVS